MFFFEVERECEFLEVSCLFFSASFLTAESTRISIKSLQRTDQSSYLCDRTRGVEARALEKTPRLDRREATTTAETGDEGAEVEALPPLLLPIEQAAAADLCEVEESARMMTEVDIVARGRGETKRIRTNEKRSVKN